MKLNLVIATAALMIMSACSQSNSDAKQSADAAKNEQVSHATITPHQGPGVYFANLSDGDKVKSPVYVEMGVDGMQVEPAGQINEGKGHHHIIIDGNYEEAGQMVAKDETHIHYGKGQTSDTLKLTPGVHSLTLQFANGAHQSYGKEWSNTISITVID